MADYVPAWIEIGGPVPRKFIPQLIKCIVGEALRDNFGGKMVAATDAEELLSYARDLQGNPGTLRLYDESANNGQFDQLEQLLEEQDIAYNRRSDGGAEFSAELVQFRPGWAARTLTLMDAIGRQTILTEYVVQALEMLRAGNTAEAITQLADLANEGVPPLEPLSFID